MYNKESLIYYIVDMQVKLVNIEKELGVSSLIADENYKVNFRLKLNNLSFNSLRKYYYVLKKVYETRLKEYELTKYESEEKLYHDIIFDYILTYANGVYDKVYNAAFGLFYRLDIDNGFDIISKVDYLYREILNLDFKLGNINKLPEESYYNEFSKKLNKLSKNKIYQISYCLGILYNAKTDLYDNIISEQQDEIYSQLLQDLSNINHDYTDYLDEMQVRSL